MSPDPQTPTRPTEPGEPAETVEAVIRHRLATAVGGWRGSLETAVPMVVFVIAWTITNDIRLSAGSALVTAALAAALRAAHGGSLQYVFSGFLATGIAAFFALRSGRAEDASPAGRSSASSSAPVTPAPQRIPSPGDAIRASCGSPPG